MVVVVVFFFFLMLHRSPSNLTKGGYKDVEEFPCMFLFSLSPHFYNKKKKKKKKKE